MAKKIFIKDPNGVQLLPATLSEIVIRKGKGESVETAVTNLNSYIDTLNGSKTTVGSVAHTAYDAASYYVSTVIANAPAAYDTLKEIADWIVSDQTGTTQVLTRLGNIETALGNTTTDTSGALKDIDDLQALTAEMKTAYVVADTKLQNNIDAVVTAYQAADKKLQDNIDAVVVSYVQGDKDTLAAAKTYTGEEINKLDYTDTAVDHNFVTAVSESNGIISVSRAQASASDIAFTAPTGSEDTSKTVAEEFTYVNKLISDLGGAALQELITAYQAADTKLQNNIDDVVTSYKAADKTLQDNIDDVVTSYKAADTKLQTNIDNVITSYEAADTKLQTNIDNVITSYEAADKTLQDNIDDVITSYEAADAALLGTASDAVTSYTIHGVWNKVDALEDAATKAHSVVTYTADTDTLKGNPTVSSTTNANGGTTYTITGGMLYSVVGTVDDITL